ncbi:hypothetical protein L596_017532 [Steinernema carpocapsae]|uniref:Uncharacterized protein n=1 Tax=Steinernema carpocapsae TaxID=34508 RepID=A0A4U5N2A3_STECR|nr:hypothetical protein L596_017532 [Steinernema carpocapsae]
MRACLVFLPIASLTFGLAKNLEDEESPEEESIYDDFPRRRLIRGFENRTAFREGIKSSWTRQRLEDFDIPDLKLMNDDEEEENKFKDCKANIGKLIDPVQAKALREYRQRGTVKPSKTIKQLESIAIENLELMDEKTIMKFKKCEADVDELVKITTTAFTIRSTTPAEPLTTTWMSTTTEIPVTTSAETPTTKTTSKAANLKRRVTRSKPRPRPDLGRVPILLYLSLRAKTRFRPLRNRHSGPGTTLIDLENRRSKRNRSMKQNRPPPLQNTFWVQWKSPCSLSRFFNSSASSALSSSLRIASAWSLLNSQVRTIKRSRPTAHFNFRSRPDRRMSGSAQVWIPIVYLIVRRATTTMANIHTTPITLPCMFAARNDAASYASLFLLRSSPLRLEQPGSQNEAFKASAGRPLLG